MDTITTVSILALPEGRALHPRLGFQPAWVKVSILALPEGRALRGGLSLSAIGWKFQSSPFPKEGRYRANKNP